MILVCMWPRHVSIIGHFDSEMDTFQTKFHDLVGSLPCPWSWSWSNTKNLGGGEVSTCSPDARRGTPALT